MRITGSFRDPSGFLFLRDGVIYRQINNIYKENYEWLINSGLYKTLIDSELLVSHEELEGKALESADAYKIIKPALIQFISYPYEWCFSQLKNAALATLKIQKIALEFGMSLKDCSAYNIQFRNSRPLLIDTLSFQKYRQTEPWVAYRQFCQHFLAPLALMSYRDVRLNQLLRVYIDGIPLDLASLLLPFRMRFKFSLFSHIHLHARSQEFFAKKSISTSDYKMNKFNLSALIDNLESVVKSIKWHGRSSQWSNYYSDTSYSREAFHQKREAVTGFLERIKPRQVWDLGANTGLFSRIPSQMGIQTISLDFDPCVVEKNYLDCVKNAETNLLPLVMDLTNPSPSIGWKNQERMSLLERGPVDTVLALALIHHLAISNNVPFDEIAGFFSKICRYIIIEFVPKNDSQVEKVLSTREDVFTDYTQQNFETEFNVSFIIQDRVKLNDSGRILYLMQKR